MSAVLMPALQAGGRAAVAVLPDVVKKVKQQLPDAYNNLKEYVGKSGKTPESLATTAVAKNDKFMAQAMMETMLRQGVTPEFISAAAPMYSIADLRQMQQQFAAIDVLERKVADSKSVKIDGDMDDVFAHDNLHIVRLCRNLGCSSDTLADLCAFVATRGPAQIARYQKWELKHGRKPI